MNLNLYCPLLCLWLLSCNLYAQDVNCGSRLTALGNSGVALQDVWSLQSNQAGLAALDKPVAAIAFQNSYLNTDLSTQSAVVAYPFKNNVIGMSFQNYGFSAYNEQRIGFAYAKRFGKNVFTAMNVNVHQVKINQYGTAQTYSVEAGIQFKANRHLLIGSHISNPNKSGYNSQVDAVVPTLLEIGASYGFSDKLILNGGLLKDLNFLTDARFGLEYNMAEWLALRGGINVNPFRQFAGFGCKYQRLRIDAAAASHPTLGYSPQMSLGYEF